ncbi:MAG: two-component regulator propeller domain-containing protein [Chitinophagales bacterium]
MRIKLFLLTILVFSFYAGMAQEKTIALKQLTSEDGLSDNQVTCMLRDSQGFMWFGTKDGLNRYDGRDFYVFRHQPDDSTSLCSNNITCLAYDLDSILWIGTVSAGFCSYNFRTQKFTTYNKNQVALLSDNINVIRFDSARNALWLGLINGGWQLFSLEKRDFLEKKDFHWARSYFDILLKDSAVFVASLMQSLKIMTFPYKEDTFRTSVSAARTINKMIAGSDGNIWCGAWDNALHEFNDKTVLLQSYVFDGTGKINFSSDEIISLAEDKNKIVWCGTKSSGIHFFDLKTKIFFDFPVSIPITSRVNYIYRDDYNRMWIGSDEGVFVYDVLQNQFTVTHLPVPGKDNSCRVFDRVITDSGTEYVAAACGLFYKKKNEWNYHFKTFDYRNERLQLFSISMDSDGAILIGTNKTMFMLDTVTMELQLIPANPLLQSLKYFSIYSSRVNCISNIRIAGHHFIAASFYGHFITIADRARKNLFWLSGTLNNKWVAENLTRKIFFDSQNRMWICGASKGISQFYLPGDFDPHSYSENDSLFHRVVVAEKNWKDIQENRSVSVNDVYDILENDDGSFWLTSESSGLMRFFPDRADAPFTFIRGDYQTLQGIARQDADNLWIVTSKGLLNYNVSMNAYKLYDFKLGVPHGIGGYFFDDRDSIFSVGFEGGFVSFDPWKILKDPEKPNVYVTRLWVMDESRDSFLSNKLVLNHDQNFLKFYLSSNCFSGNEQVRYMYQLTDIDEDWRTSDNPFITYTNLPPGHFNFKYKAINRDGVESEIRSLSLSIIPPFYKTIYFYLTFILLLLSTVYGFYRYRIRQILKLQEVRNKIARDLHDDIGSTIGSINFYSQVANVRLNKEVHKDTKGILEKIETMSREIIDKTGDAVWAANSANDTMNSLMLRIESYAAAILGTAGIRFRINWDEKSTNTFLKMEERKNLFLIYKEAIHNIIKYAAASEVEISVNRNADRLEMLIADNGKGFDTRNNAYNGNGIKNMKARAESMNGTFSITSMQHQGTVIKVAVSDN